MPRLGQSQLGASTICASAYPNDKCGANGLPLTPNSIKILGRFQTLKTIEHPGLCKYLDLVGSKHERMIIVAEHHTRNLATEQKVGNLRSVDDLVHLAHGVLSALAYMNGLGLVHRNLSPYNVLYTERREVKLAKYGLYYATGYGADVSFPVGKCAYMAPEVISEGRVEVGEYVSDRTRTPSGPKVDVWSLGVLLLETWMGCPLWPTLTLQQIIYKIIGFLHIDCHPVDSIVKDHQAQKRLQELPDELVDLLRTCLTVSPTNRPLPCQLLTHPVFKELQQNESRVENGFNMFSTKLRCGDLDLTTLELDAQLNGDCTDHLAERSVEEVYYLWRLAGGDLEGTLKKAGLIKGRPPITAMASFVIEDGEIFGQERDTGVLLNDTVVCLSQEQLRQRLSKVEQAAYYPLLEDDPPGAPTSCPLPASPSTGDLSDTSSLPLVIKEKDVEYQFHRIILYERLLKAYPYKRTHIWREARVDIPPLLRPLVWAAILEVEGDVQGQYEAIDKETPTPTDRQIEVDIPRCHQYNELLSSPAGHAKFKRVLKAWVVSHPEYVYWQGLDSLCAPFLHLNFNNEALAFACLDAFIPKYLHKFFLKDNSKVIQEYLAVFSHLIAFHEPELSNHLDGIGFIPDLYAIPWFLTMYAHVFPLHKIFHLWDTLLLGNSSFPLCIGVAILQQLKDQLLKNGFNECILLFSDMPEIDIERCVRDSIKIFCSTPKSATYREHARPAKKPHEGENGRGRRENGRGRRENGRGERETNQDYQQMHAGQSMEPLPLEDLKCEKCPRISSEDLVELCGLRGPPSTAGRSPHKRSNKVRIIAIDIRSSDDYNRGAVPTSINIPFNSAFNGEGELVLTPAVQTLNQHKHQVKVVVGSRGRNAVTFAGNLIHLGYSKVCVLHKGIDALKPTGLLVVPPPDL